MTDQFSEALQPHVNNLYVMLEFGSFVREMAKDTGMSEDDVEKLVLLCLTEFKDES